MNGIDVVHVVVVVFFALKKNKVGEFGMHQVFLVLFVGQEKSNNAFNMFFFSHNVVLGKLDKMT